MMHKHKYLFGCFSCEKIFHGSNYCIFTSPLFGMSVKDVYYQTLLLSKFDGVEVDKACMVCYTQSVSDSISDCPGSYI